MTNDANLMRMTNQIAANLSGGRDDETAAAAICHHLEIFWARPLKYRLVANLERENAELSLLARRAASHQARRAPAR